MLQVFLVYHSYLDSCEGLGGGGRWEEPQMVGAFTTKNKARNWVRQQRKKHKFDWKVRFSYKTLNVA